MGGETFFQNLQALLARPDNEDLSDLLEVYQLCLLLGFQGRYGGAGREQVAGWTRTVADRMARIRGVSGSLSPAWAPPGDEVIPIPKDPWIRPLGYTALAAVAAGLFLSLLFWFWQQSWIADLRAALR